MTPIELIEYLDHVYSSLIIDNAQIEQAVKRIAYDTNNDPRLRAAVQWDEAGLNSTIKQMLRQIQYLQHSLKELNANQQVQERIL